MMFLPPPPPALIQVMTPAESEWTLDAARSAAIEAVESASGSTKIVGLVVLPSQRASGWVACGHVNTGDAQAPHMDRFVAFVPGTIALVANEDPELVEEFWSAVGCDTPAE
ncbi:hypothetical protein [Salinarimonas soli]|uniref:Uncharacterized protein n=1 Tax=Salinarimonas soli TaxID=1638099 RepID=A0A5B2VFQ0_9HYPH|nr:hypothetical protein [Salinarimonas soli]KAA2237951.1 hypothetical protein F0L46_06675 [Salinarimonas soli]